MASNELGLIGLGVAAAASWFWFSKPEAEKPSKAKGQGKPSKGKKVNGTGTQTRDGANEETLIVTEARIFDAIPQKSTKETGQIDNGESVLIPDLVSDKTAATSGFLATVQRDFNIINDHTVITKTDVSSEPALANGIVEATKDTVSEAPTVEEIVEEITSSLPAASIDIAEVETVTEVQAPQAGVDTIVEEVRTRVDIHPQNDIADLNDVSDTPDEIMPMNETITPTDFAKRLHEGSVPTNPENMDEAPLTQENSTSDKAVQQSDDHDRNLHNSNIDIVPESTNLTEDSTSRDLNDTTAPKSDAITNGTKLHNDDEETPKPASNPQDVVQDVKNAVTDFANKIATSDPVIKAKDVVLETTKNVKELPILSGENASPAEPVTTIVKDEESKDMVKHLDEENLSEESPSMNNQNTTSAERAVNEKQDTAQEMANETDELNTPSEKESSQAPIANALESNISSSIKNGVQAAITNVSELAASSKDVLAQSAPVQSLKKSIQPILAPSQASTESSQIQPFEYIPDNFHSTNISPLCMPSVSPMKHDETEQVHIEDVQDDQDLDVRSQTGASSLVREASMNDEENPDVSISKEQEENTTSKMFLFVPDNFHTTRISPLTMPSIPVQRDVIAPVEPVQGTHIPERNTDTAKDFTSADKGMTMRESSTSGGAQSTEVPAIPTEPLPETDDINTQGTPDSDVQAIRFASPFKFIPDDFHTSPISPLSMPSVPLVLPTENSSDVQDHGDAPKLVEAQAGLSGRVTDVKSVDLDTEHTMSSTQATNHDTVFEVPRSLFSSAADGWHDHGLNPKNFPNISFPTPPLPTTGLTISAEKASSNLTPSVPALDIQKESKTLDTFNDVTAPVSETSSKDENDLDEFMNSLINPKNMPLRITKAL